MKAQPTLVQRKRPAAALQPATSLEHAAVQPLAGQGAGRPAPPALPGDGAGHDFSRVPLQARLAVNRPGDRYEQEADRVAEQVVHGATPLRRYAAGPVQSVNAPPIVHEVLRSPGQPLDAATRADLEPRFGHDFSGVRVHTDAPAAESARVVNAMAYTVGRDVVFGAGHYRPQDRAGQKLLSHELTHTIQQEGVHWIPGEIAVDPDEGAESEARTAATAIAAGRSTSSGSIGSTPRGLSRVPGDEEPEEPDVLAAGEGFRWIGTPSNPILAIRPSWLRRMDVRSNTASITGRQHPRVMRALMAELLPRYPWANMERVERNLATLSLQLTPASWDQEEAHVPVARSIFQVIGLPPDRPVQLFRTTDGLEFYADTLTFYQGVGDDPDARQTAKAALAEQIALAFEREIGAPVLPSQRRYLIEALVQSAPDGAAVWRNRASENTLIELFGEVAWREYAGRPRDEDQQEGAIIQIEGGGDSFRLPSGLSATDRELVLRVLREISRGGAPPSAAVEAVEPPEPLSLSQPDVEALKALDADPDRDELIALLREGRPREPDGRQPMVADIVETARARLAWQRAEQTLGIEAREGEREERPIVPRPVHGRIVNPDRLVPDLEAQFQFETLDQVDAYRVPMVGIHWYARRVPTADEPNPPILEDDVTNYIEVRSHGLLNERIFEVTFEEPGDYEIRAFVNHNFYLPAQFTTTVRVITEAAILGEFRGRAEGGWGREQGTAPYRFEAIASDERLAETGAGLALSALGGPTTGGGLAGPVLDLLPASGYEMGTRAEGQLSEAAATEHAVTLFDRKDQLVAERDRLDQMVALYENSRDANARDIVEQIRERRDRVQAAIDQLDRLIEDDGGSPPYPVPVRAFFASRTQGVRSAPLTLVTYFTADGEGEDLRYHGHIYDQSEVVESRHYHYEADAASYEALMEALFLELTQSYPNGTVSFAFQVYENLEPTSRFVRFERVTDTLEQDVRDVVFSSAANIVVNLVATLLTIFPPTTALGLTLGIAYNAASLAASTSLDLRRGTFSAERTVLQLGQIALDTVPLVGRATRVLVLSGRTYRVIEATQLAGAVYLLTEEAAIQIQNLRDGQITQLSQLQQRIHEVESVNASDPELDDLRRQETVLIQSIRDASFNVYSDLVTTQTLTIGSSALLRHAATPYVTGRGLQVEPDVTSRREQAGGGGAGGSGVLPLRSGAPGHQGATAEGTGEAFHYEYHPEAPPPAVERRRVPGRVDQPGAITAREDPVATTSREESATAPTRERWPDIEEETRPRDDESAREPTSELPGPWQLTPEVALPESLLAAQQAGISDLVLESGTVMTRADFPDVVPDRPIPPGRQAPERLGTTGRTVSSSDIQNVEVRADLRLVQDALEGSGARIVDVRVDQTQVSTGGGRVGTNRPDLQLTILQAELGGRRIYVEYDRAPGTRAMEHARRIISNDPDAIVILKILDFEPSPRRRR